MRTPALDAAFRATRYRVDSAAGGFDLRIGVVNPDFDDFLRRQGVSRWGLLTAYNPRGTRRDDENPARLQQLLGRLQRLGRKFIPACNVADDGSWPAEPGVVVLHIDESALCQLAADFDQLAVVCGEVGKPPRLVWLESSG